MPDSLILWRDRRGALSWPRIVTLALLVLPALLALADAARGALNARPLNDLIHRSGWWALVFLLVSLAITPLRRSARFAKLVDLRRMIGVASFAYAFTHLGLYVADEKFDLAKVAGEIASRLYLTIGFLALVGLGVLAVTSNDPMVKRLGGLRWRRLHQVTYGLALLALVHFFQQTKADITLPTLFAGLLAWLYGYRLLARLRGEASLTPPVLAVLAVAASLLTFLGEALGIGLSFGVSPLQILASVLDLDLGVRPGWWVLAAGLCVAALDLVRNVLLRPAPAPARPRMAAASR